MKKVLVLMMTLVLMLTFVACDGEASGGNSSATLTEKEVVEELFESGALDNMQNFLKSSDGVSEFCSVSPEWGTNSAINVEYYESGYVKRFEQTATIISTGKPYHSIDIFDDYQLSFDDEFLEQYEMYVMEIPEGDFSFHVNESVYFGGIAEQDSEYTVTMNSEALGHLALALVLDFLGGSYETQEEEITYLENRKTYYESDEFKESLETLVAQAMTMEVTFSKVVVRGVSYDPEPLSEYMNSNYAKYFANQLSQALVMSIEQYIWMLENSIDY